jgi:uncharacterized membrane protein
MAIHFFWIVGMLLFVAVCAAFVVGIVFLATRTQARPAPAGGQTPLDILNARLARGEITPGEYRTARDLLKQS